MTKTENKVFNDLFSVLFTACLSALVISCCEYFLIAVKPRVCGLSRFIYQRVFRVLSPSVNHMFSPVSFSQPCAPANPLAEKP